MRIISGKYKGHRLTAPKNLPVRPTTDLSKESLFNILNHQFNFHDLVVLDLFSGTGNISYEFASRGAGPITAVDGEYKCIQFIQSVIAKWDLDIHVIKSDVFKFLEKTKTKYDIIFADPPYDMDQKKFEQIIITIFERDLLQEDGMMIVEHSPHTVLDHLVNFSSKRKYGSSIFSFFEYDYEEEQMDSFLEDEED